jgi:hypothetical protein
VKSWRKEHDPMQHGARTSWPDLVFAVSQSW